MKRIIPSFSNFGSMSSMFTNTRTNIRTIYARAFSSTVTTTSTATKPITMYGWSMSYFSVKLECYFKLKQIPFNMKHLNILDFSTINKKVGAHVMPVVVTTNNKWIQDTRHIIDKYEKDFPNNSIFPQTPKKHFISCLLEAWGDEFWVPMAMHYRWSFPENEDFFRREAGNNLLPHFPKYLQNCASSGPITTLREFLPAVGVIPAQYFMIEEWTQNMLNLLENHFKSHDFLLGNVPTIGDFGLVGPLIPHLSRDPYPKEHILNEQNYPHICRWVNDMSNPRKSYEYDNAAKCDDIPNTLVPILFHVFNEFIPMIEQMIEPVMELRDNSKFYTSKDNGMNSVHKPLPRKLRNIQFPLYFNEDINSPLKYMYIKSTLPFHLYKMQTVLNGYTNMPTYDKYKIENYLTNFDLLCTNVNYRDKILNMKIPELDRVNVRVKFT